MHIAMNNFIRSVRGLVRLHDAIVVYYQAIVGYCR
jgi:hypothetical protein